MLGMVNVVALFVGTALIWARVVLEPPDDAVDVVVPPLAAPDAPDDPAAPTMASRSAPNSQKTPATVAPPATAPQMKSRRDCWA